MTNGKNYNPNKATFQQKKAYLEKKLILAKKDADKKPKIKKNSPKQTCPLTKKCAKHEIKIKLNTRYFVPEKEKVKITYTIKGKPKKISKIKMVVSTKKKPKTIIHESTIKGPYKLKGEVEWDGTKVNGSDFYKTLNVPQSPYLIRFVLYADGCSGCESNREKIQVKLVKLDILVDEPIKTKPSDTVKKLQEELYPDNQLHVVKTSKSPDTKDREGRIYFLSPVFKTSPDEMYDNTSFSEYESHVKKGHDVQILARLWLLGKDKKKKRCANAVYKVPILWDYIYDTDKQYKKDLTSKNRSVAGNEKKYLTKVSKHKKSVTHPKGRNCHKDLGGLRVEIPARTSDEKHWEPLVSSWGFEVPKTRKWAGYTYGAQVDKTDVDSGITFQTGRFAGDAYHITAFVDLKKEYDVLDEGKPYKKGKKFKSNSLLIRNWRRVPIARNYYTGSAGTRAKLSDLQDGYKRAAVDIVYVNGVTDRNVEAEWKLKYQTVITSKSATNKFIKFATLNDPQKYPVRYKNWTAFRQAKTTYINAGATQIERDLRSIELMMLPSTENEYKRKCEATASDIYFAVVKEFTKTITDKGILIFKFGEQGSHNQLPLSYTLGYAPSALSKRHQAVILIFKPNAERITMLHEVGHTLFLAHSSNHGRTASSTPTGIDEDAHDDNRVCMMSYANNRACFCGQCILKLSGWKVHNKVDKDGNIS